jgi:hypothetical protein
VTAGTEPAGLPVGITTAGGFVALSQVLRGEVFAAFAWACAPEGLATRRQLAARRLRPGRVEPVARLVWRRGERWADLHPVAAALPKKPATAGQARGLAAAMRVRRTCTACGVDAGYCLPTSWGRVCIDCHETRSAPGFPAAPGAATAAA